MLVKSKETSHAVATDVVDWALQQKIINLEQRHRMLKEIAQRAGGRCLPQSRRWKCMRIRTRKPWKSMEIHANSTLKAGLGGVSTPSWAFQSVCL